MKKIAVIGLGYVGLPLAVEFGKSFEVMSYDLNKARVQELESGEDSTNECSADQIASANYLTFSYNINDIKDASIYSNCANSIFQNNRPDLRPLISASKAIEVS